MKARPSFCILHSAFCISLCIAFAATSALANWQYGLKWGYVRATKSMEWPTTTNACPTGAEFAVTPASDHGYGVVYWGQMHFDGSQYRFCGHIDDYFTLKVDGATVATTVNRNTSCEDAFGNVTPSEGWHDIEVWLFNSGTQNPSGPTSNASRGFYATNGICFTRNDTTSTTADGYIPLATTYAGNILRYDDGVYENDAFVVGADPAYAGNMVDMSPAFGGYLDMVPGTNISCSAPGLTCPSDSLRLTCTGYVFTVTDLDIGQGVSNVLSRTAGSATTFSYTHDGHRGDLVWLFDDEVLCTFSYGGGTVLLDGTPAEASHWLDRRSVHTLVAQPAEGYTFDSWSLDGVMIEGATLELDCSEAHVVIASFLLSSGSQDKVYAGATDGDWDTASNWDPAGVPTVSDDVYIPAGVRVRVPLSANVHSLTVSNNAAVSIFGASSAYTAPSTVSVLASGGTASALFGRLAADYTTSAQIGLHSVGDVTLLGSGQLIVGGFLQAARSRVDIGGDLTLSGTSKMAVYAGPTNGVSRAAGGGEVEVAGTATVGAGTTLELFCHFGKSGVSDAITGRGSAVVLDFAETVVEAGGKIVSSYGSSNYTQSTCRQGAGTKYNGAGHGGVGGKGGESSANVAGGPAYGNELAPLLPGSYGRAEVSFGGGIVRLKTGSLTLNGTISADAAFVRSKSWESGGSSGGSVWITCDSFSMGSSGLLSANGTDGFPHSTFHCGGGAGGRIAVGVGLTDAQIASLGASGSAPDLSSPVSLVSMYPANVSVAGGAGVLTGKAGNEGSAVYYAGVPSGKVILSVCADGPAVNYGLNPPMGPQILDQGAAVQATAPEFAPVDANDTIRAFCTGWKISSAASGNVLASGAGTNCAYASLTENATLEWSFEVRYLLSASACGSGTLAGNASWVPAGATVSLAATPSEGAAFLAWASPFFLSKTEIATPSLSFAMPALPTTIYAVFDQGRTLATKTWSGASGGDWDTASNWTPAGVPTPNDAVVIPAGAIVSASGMVAAGSLSVGSGANLSIFGAVTDFFKTFTTASLTSAASTTAGARNAADCTTKTPLTLSVADDFALAPSASVSLGGIGQVRPSTLYVGGDLSLAHDARLAIYPGPANGTSVTRSTGGAHAFVLGSATIATNATIHSHGVLNRLGSAKGDIAPVIWEVGALTVDAGGAIVSHTGHSSYGSDYSLETNGAKTLGGQWAGAGHGGAGGKGTSTQGTSATPNVAGGTTYDAPYAPLLPGRIARYTSIGGGVVRIYASAASLHGTLDASATLLLNTYETGGASGGSVLLFADTFTSGPTARLVSRGRAGYKGSKAFNCGGGGGGRVAVVVGASPEQKEQLLATGDTTARSVQRIDLLGEQRFYKGTADVSGGAGSTVAEPGADGTAWMLRFVRPGTILFLQ